MPIGTQNPAIPGCGFHHISIMTRDFETSLAFYRDVLGMRVHFTWDSAGRPFGLLDAGDGAYIELQGPKPDSNVDVPAIPLAHFALATTDARAAIEKVRAAGYAVTVEPKDVNLGGTLPVTVAFFTGPSGESVEFFQER